MANHASHAALPYPIKGARYTLLIPYLDDDGDPTDPTTPDTEISEDDGSATDTAEEVSSPKNSVGMLTLSGAETDCSVLSLAAKAASGPKTTLLTLSPRVLASVGTGTLSAGSSGGGTLGTLLAYDVTGCFIKTTGGTGGGGTGGANNQVRKIITYNTGSGAFTVAPNWETTPSTDTTYDILLPEGVTLGMLKALNPATAGRTVDLDSSGRVILQPTQSGVTIPTVTTLTNAPSDSSGVTTLLSRVPSGIFTGITSLAQWLGLLAGKQSGNSTARTEIRATGGGSGTFDETTDSLEAVRDNMGTAQTGDSYARLGAPAGASVSADVAAVKTDTGNLVTRITSTLFSGITSLAQWLGAMAGKQTADSTARTEIRATGSGSGTFDETTDSNEAIRDNMGTAQTGDSYARIGANGSGLTAVPWNASWDAEVQSEVQDAIEANHLDHLLAATYDPANKPGASDALLNELVENDAGVSRYSANALEQAPTGGGGGGGDWTSGEKEQIRHRLGIDGDSAAPSATPSLATAAAATAIEADTQDIQARLPAALVSGRIDASVGAMASNVMTAAAAAADLTAELQSGLATAASIAALNNVSTAQVQTAAAAALTAYDPPTRTEATADKDEVIAAIPTSAEIGDAVLDEVVEGSTTLRQSMRLANTANGGIVDGMGTTNVTARDLADTKNRIDAVVDEDGNRSAVTLDLT